MSSPHVVEVRDVSKRFVIRKEKSLKERVVNFGRSNLHKEDFWALRDISLDIEAGTTVGLIGLVAVWVAQRVFARLQGNFAHEL